MNELRVFQNSEFGDLGVMEIEGKPYFPATACAKKLGYENQRDAILRHCPSVVKHDVGVCTGVNADGDPAMQTVTMNFIPEGDLYRLIAHSRLPAAVRFEKWVFDEVLPTIRQTGGYVADMSAIVAAAVKETLRQIMPMLRPDEPICRPPHTRRKPNPCIVGTLSDDIRQDVEDMITEGRMTYAEISAYMYDRYGVQVSKSSIWRYASKIYDTMERSGERPFCGTLRNSRQNGY